MSFDSQRVLSTVIGASTLLLTTLVQAQPSPTEVAPEQPVQTPPAAVAKIQEPAADQPQPAPVVDTPAPAPLPEPPPPALVPAMPARGDDGPQVLFHSDNGLRLSGYGGVDVGYTRVAGENAVLACGGGALLMSRTFSLGLMGCGVPTRIPGENYSIVTHEAGDRLEFAYAGVVAGYHFFPKKLYNLSLSAMVGGGAASIVNRHDQTWSDNHDTNHDHVKSVDPLFVAEPRLTGYVNLTRWARVGAFVGYRFVGGVDMRNLSSADMSGPVAGGSVQFGWF